MSKELIASILRDIAEGRTPREQGLARCRALKQVAASERAEARPLPTAAVAIIGVAGRYPQAPDVESFWANLRAGRDSITTLPPGRWEDVRQDYRWGGFLDDVDRFDAAFFGISPREAERMDPQERIFLETAWTALEDAGYTRRALQSSASGDLPGNVGVFVGVTYQEYQLHGAELQARGRDTALPGISASAANRVSYFCNFHGPSMAVDSMCSSSLTAIHLACQSLRSGDCELALAGGVNLSLHPNKYLILSQGQFLSESGRCASFGEGGNGYVPGEGCGCVLLKPLEHAIRDGDRIHAVIRGTSLNHAGKTNGYTVPNPHAQAAVIRRALRAAGVEAGQLGYVEAHGTGTALGDPIEIAGLLEAYETAGAGVGICAIGSVKSNIGHSEAAAGIAGLTKVLLMMRHRELVPSLHATSLNPNIDFSASPFRVQRELSAWEPRDGRRIAGISSFGAGGANAHLIVEEWPDAREYRGASALQPPALVVLSAQNQDRLRESVTRLRRIGDVPLGDLAYTLQIGREAMESRLACVVRTRAELDVCLDAWLASPGTAAGVHVGAGTRELGVTPRRAPAPEVGARVDAALASGNLEDLAGLWVQGVPLDWGRLRRDVPGRRVSAPGYPFDRSQRHWFDSYERRRVQREVAAPPAEIPISLSVVSCELIDDAIALVRLCDRARRNQMGEAMVGELDRIFRGIGEDSRVKVVVLSGYDEVFCLGGDKRALVDISDRRLRYTDVPFVYRGLLDCPVPVIAAMEGHAIGGGLAFGCQADIVYLAEESVYCANFMQYGFTPGMGATLFFKEKLGSNLASEMMFSADSMTGATLRAKGAPLTITPRGEVLGEALARARSLAAKPRQALQLLKRTLAERILRELPNVVREELEMHEQTITRVDVRQTIEERIDRMEALSAVRVPASTGEAARATVDRTTGPGTSSGQATAAASPGAKPWALDRSQVEERLRDIVTHLLHLEPQTLRVDVPFQELGMDSIAAVELARDVNAAYRLNLDAVALYDHPTLRQYAGHVLDELERARTSLDTVRGERGCAPADRPHGMESHAVRKRTLRPLEDAPSAPAQARSERTRVLLRRATSPTAQPKATVSLREDAPARTARVSLLEPMPSALEDAGTARRGRDVDGGRAVAVIGMAGRFPGAPDLESFWENLSRGTCSIREVPTSRWSLDAVYDPRPMQPNKTYSRWGGFLDHVESFDPLFFHLSPAEATQMDPQQRLFLQAAWHAIEDAGYAAEELSGERCGVFVGVGQGDYMSVLQETGQAPAAQALLGNTCSMLSGRIGYFLNLTGPNMSIDTACSSSLVAIHQACQSISLGESALALAGGVYVMTTPAMHLMTSRGAMLSPTGLCRSFDQLADGFVLAEGVGVLLLKALERAMDDGDPIHGVIRGSAINYDGATNGITAPSAASQERLVVQVQASGGIAPESIGMVEAHGTGTKLGDPIEVRALTRAFRRQTDQTGFCAIGSVKSNIGHTLAAAGVAGVLKSLLCLKHRKLVPSLHYERCNEHIDFEASPFYVSTQLRDWKLSDGQNKRRAAVSSFGMSGTNAHVVLEEYVRRAPAECTKPGYRLLTLSAKSQGALEARTRDLARWLERHGDAVSLDDVAFTLGKGRSHFAHRCALVVRSTSEAISALEAGSIVGDVPRFDGCCGEIAPEDRVIHREVLEQVVAALGNLELAEAAAREKWTTLASLYVKGYELPWARLSSGRAARRVSLPVYPFAEERCWPKLPSVAAHTRTLRGDESFLRDHRIRGRGVVPGMQILELVREAAERTGVGRVQELRGVEWRHPIVVEDRPVDVSISFTSQGGATGFEVQCTTGGDAPAITCAAGTALLSGSTDPMPARMDIEATRARCASTWSGEACYASFERAGIQYGASFRPLEALWFGTGEALGRLRAPVAPGGSTGSVHPALLDGGLQCGLGILLGERDAERSPEIACALDSLRVHAEFTEELWAHVVRTPEGAYDAVLADTAGQVVAEIRGVRTRRLAARGSSGTGAASRAHPGAVCGPLVCIPQWVSEPQRRGVLFVGERTVLYTGRCAWIADALRADGIAPELVPLPRDRAAASDDPGAIESAVVDLLERVQQRVRVGSSARHQYALLVSDEDDPCCWSPLLGLLRTAVLEDPRVCALVLRCGRSPSGRETCARVREELEAHVDGVLELRWHPRTGAREVRRLCEVDLGEAPRSSPFRAGGVYWITGGLGGLGRITARHLARAAGARVVLSGRSEPSADASEIVADLEAAGVEVLVLPCDVARRESVEAALATIAARFGRVTGIIHSAGVIQDAFLLKKTPEQVRRVLAPKITGLLELTRAARGADLEFMWLYSAAAGAFGNVGQCDYSSANAFMDAFAEQSEQKVVSIGWPLWADGGMTPGRAVAGRMWIESGAEALPTPVGLDLLDRISGAPHSHVVVLYGDAERLRRTLIHPPDRGPDDSRARSVTTQSSDAGISRRLLESLARELSVPLQLAPDRIDPDQPFEEYGLDSVMVLEVTRQLEQSFGPLPKTLFFEHPNLRALSGYLMQAHPDSAAKLVGEPSPPETITETPRRRDLEHARASAAGPVEQLLVGAREIAIIGVSGRYPKAPTLDDFWQNLAAGVDCVGEIPEDRWDHSQYFDAQANGGGKVRSKWGGFLGDVKRFDASFFKISPLEAELMDPQERLLLEVAWQTFEDAGYTRDANACLRVGVYVGLMYSEYQLYGAAEQAQGRPLALAGSPASAANRISYQLNVSGPSMAVDSMCSSSLTAIHLACQALRAGEIDMALAGGVNLSLHPNKYLLLGQGQFASSKGRCESFGAGGDGYVPSEGVGCVLLKPLVRAIQDRDHIHAVIQGSALNHGGKTNGYTVPNPRAQQEVIEAALRDAGVGPNAISYVEAHGTGTALGDPIEIAGLAGAFAGDEAPAGRCAIGSVKSNIGHAESAAGIAGLTKIVLQMKHRQLVPSLHSRSLNPHIEFTGTPFVVQQELAPWDAAEPRVAGLSSFGAGGANAHLVVREWPGSPAGLTREASAPSQAFPVLLSARSEVQLRRRASDLRGHLAVNPSRHDLAAVAFTLRVGREAMEHRLGFVASNVAETVTKLDAWLHDGRVAASADAALETEVRRWVEGRGSALTRLEFPDQGADSPGRVPLPTYPFAGERYWFPRVPELQAERDYAFERLLTGGEPWLAHHRVHGQVMMPGLAYLDWALEAVRELAPAAGISLHDVVWYRPLVVDRERRVRLSLARREVEGALRFEFQVGACDGDPTDADASARAYCRGSVCFDPPVRRTPRDHSESAAPEAPHGSGERDLARIASELPLLFDESHVESFYAGFARAGIEYGPAFRNIRRMWGDHERCLAKVEAQHARDPGGRSILDPALADAALQTLSGIARYDAAGGTLLPFAVREWRELAPLPSSFYVLAERCAERGFDVTLMRPDGSTCGRLRGVELRPSSDPLTGSLQRLCWRPSPLPNGAARSGEAAGGVLVVFAGACYDLQESIRSFEHDRSVHLVCIEAGAFTAAADEAATLDPTDSTALDALVRKLPELEQVYFLGGLDAESTGELEVASLLRGHHLGTLACFRLVQALLRGGYAERALRLCVLMQQTQTADDCQVDPRSAGLLGFCQSLAREYPRWSVLPIDVDRTTLANRDAHVALLENVSREAGSPALGAAAYRRGVRFEATLEPASLPSNGPSAIREGGCYVIAGGAGGIGWTITRALVEGFRAQTIWLGRRPFDADVRERAEALRPYGPVPRYIQVDIADRGRMEAVAAELRREGRAIHGVIHSALALSDQRVEHMRDADFEAPLRAKLLGSIVLADTLGRAASDWVCFFSSAQALISAPGQANYAAGSTFQDAYAHALRSLLRQSVYVINWGFWGSVGAVAGEAYRERMRRIGIGSITPSEGVLAFLRCLASDSAQLVVLKRAHAEGSNEAGGGAEPGPPTHTRVWERVLARLPADSPRQEEIRTLDSAGEAYAALDAIARRALGGVLESSGLRDALGDAPTGEELRIRLGILDPYRRLWEALVELLVEDGTLRRRGEGLEWAAEPVDATPRARQLERDLEALRRRAPELASQIELVERSVSQLPEVLSGRMRAHEVLFPRASLSGVAAFYGGHAIADHFNRRVAEIVRACGEGIGGEPGAMPPLRLLEIGAGTGATTAVVLDALAGSGRRIEYWYTDVSEAFLTHGRSRFEVRSRDGLEIRFARFDVERDPQEQSLEAESFDVILGSNVLHATRSLEVSLSHVAVLLRPESLLVFDEFSASRPFMTLTFGLTEGWWRFEDRELRAPHGPGAPVESWRVALERAGFGRVRVATPESESAGRFVMLAQRAGAVSHEERRHGRASRVGLEDALPTRSGDACDGAAGFVRQEIAAALKLPVARIAPAERFETLGVDSILAVVVTDRLEKTFGSLPRALLFEHPTLERLATYLAAQHERRWSALEAELRPRRAAQEPLRPSGRRPEQTTARSAPSRVELVPRAAATLEPLEHAESIAIIGLGGRYPGAPDLESFWRHLRDGVDCITEIPPSRWPADRFYAPDATTLTSGAARSKWGGFIDGVEDFDAGLFQIAPVEAELIDPQERLFLEVAWETFESAGYARRHLAELQEREGRGVGVFVGAMYQMYPRVARQPLTATASYWSIANRVSYFFDLRGPSLAVDTACSSSAVAIHMACESLRRGESVMAIAGGVNLSLHPDKYLALQASGMLGSEPHSRCLGRGDGFVPGEGVGAVLLKPLARARADGDVIHGIVRASRIYQNGRGNGYRVPDPDAQARALQALFEEAHIEPESVDYVEVAANGIPLGEAVEISALRRVFGESSSGTCAIGSVKSNIGHLEAASGISQLTKVLLQLRHAALVPSLHAEPDHAELGLARTRFRVQQELAPWRAVRGRDRRALIHSAGAGGTGAYLLVDGHAPHGASALDEGTGQMAASLEHAVESEPTSRDHRESMPCEEACVVVLSARGVRALDQHRLRLAERVRLQMDDIELRDLAFTLQMGREPLPDRMAVVASSMADLLEKLTEAPKSGGPQVGVYRGSGGVVGEPIGMLLEGPAGAAFVDTLLRTRDLDKLARLWVAGFEVDWRLLYAERPPRRVELPTYPFVRQRYWPEGGSTLADGSRVSDAVGLAVDADPGAIDAVLARVVCSVLRLEASELELDRPLVEYGVDSMLATMIMERVRERFGRSLSLAALVEHPTLRALARYVSEDMTRPGADRVRGHPPELIAIQPRGTQPASFWVHGLVGFAQLYRKLSAVLGADFPVYGLQARGVDAQRAPFDRIESMAAHYVACVRSVRPHGPYVLGGYSAGGLVALDMARQLEAAGERVSRVFLLDTYPHSARTTDAIEGAVNYAMRAIMTANLFLTGEGAEREPIRVEELEGVHPDQHVLRLLDCIAERGGTQLERDVVYRVLKGSIDVSNSMGEALRRHAPPVYSASDVVFFRATRKFIESGNALGLPEMDLDVGDRVDSWRAQIASQLEVVDVDCDHFGLLEEPALRALGREVATRISHGPRASRHSRVRAERQTAVVLGGGFAGLLAARALADHCESVTVLERDSLERGASLRRGVPQGGHLHNLLRGGLDVLGDLFPGFEEDLLELGSVPFRLGYDMLQEDEVGVWPQRDLGLTNLCQTRPVLEWAIRRRLLDLPNVRIQERAMAGELLWSADGARVTGIRSVDASQRVTEHRACMVVNATGRGGALFRQLEKRGWRAPEETRIRVDLGYSSCLFTPPIDASRTWKGAYSYTTGSDGSVRQGGSILPVEHGQWIVTLGGRRGNRPPTDLAGFIEFARGFETPTIHAAIRAAKPVTGRIAHFRFPESRLRHFERLDAVPQGLLHLGDAVCSVDPVFGQGMSCAALQVKLLAGLLRRRREAVDPWDGLERELFSRLPSVVGAPWAMAAKSNFEYADGEGSPDYQRFLALSRRAMHDADMHRAVIEVFHLVKVYDELREAEERDMRHGGGAGALLEGERT